VSKLQVLAVIFVFVFPMALFADQIVLKNGDRLTGTIEKSDDKTLIIKTEFAGEVTVQWPAIQEITSTQKLNVTLNDGKTIVGPVTTSDGNLTVTTANAGPVTEPRTSVTKVLGEAEQAAYEKSLHPGLLEGWQGGANVGFGLTRGNSQTKNLALAINADRKGWNDKLSLYTNSIYATNDAPGATPSTTANAVQGGIRYDHDITPKIFAYVGADFQTDALQTLDLRSVFGGGLGWHVIKNDHTTFDLLGGADYTREKYSALPSRSFAVISAGEELTHKLGMSTLLTEKLYFFPNLNDTGEYRATFNLGTVTKISKWLGWQNAFGDIYVTNPPAGAKQNDILLTTGLNFSFAH
jgi:putative salt-induced outer membrane protein YdiY/small nuclear ribonucleoprotein (snRNP)-like protein